MQIDEKNIDIYPDIVSLTEAAVELVVTIAREAVAARGRFTIALAGGNTPRPLYERLSQPPYLSRLPWEQTLIFWSDERFVHLDDERSNAGAAMELMLNHTPVPTRQIFPMFCEDIEVVEAAERYEGIVQSVFGNEEPRLDLVLLGCGEDGHTASLFPGSPILQQARSLVSAVVKDSPDVPRITMTLPLLNRTREIIFIVAGENKAEIISQVLRKHSGADPLPASLVAPTSGLVRWLLDQKAAQFLDT